MIGAFNKILNRYNVGTNGAWHDSTGLGNVVNDYVDVRAHPFTMTGDKRAKMLSDYVNAIEKGAWELPMVESAYREMKFCRYNDLYKTTLDFHLPDTVCAGALAEYAARRMAPVVSPLVVPRDHSPTALERNFIAERYRDERSIHTSEPVSSIELAVT
jgi:hypothetical protein